MRLRLWLFMPILIYLFFGCAADSPETTPAPTTETTTITTTACPTEAAVATVETDPQIVVPTVSQVVEEMTIEEKVGQLFLARCPSSNAIEDIDTYHLGGYILFGQDFANQIPITMTQIISAYQEASPIPLLIAVDEEGGTVNRVSNRQAFRDTPFPSPRSLYDQGGMETVLAAETEKCQLLSSLGINVNMAPVCDISTDPGSFMYRRSLGQSPEITSKFISQTVAIMDVHEIGSVLKHFPGYGNNTDTHTGIAVDRRSLEELEGYDLIPFAAGIEAGCDCILVSHTIVECLDPEMPASLSPAVHNYLREEMGFEGVIVTDDLAMAAITKLYGKKEAAVLAVLAGNDLLCATDYAVQYPAVVSAVRSGRIPLSLLNAVVERLLQWKINLGILDLSAMNGR